jgi:hypothetical protein
VLGDEEGGDRRDDERPEHYLREAAQTSTTAAFGTSKA